MTGFVVVLVATALAALLVLVVLSIGRAGPMSAYAHRRARISAVVVYVLAVVLLAIDSIHRALT